jgi:hypothetical protein
LHPRDAGMIQHRKSLNIILHINRNHRDISIDVEKGFVKIHPFMIKVLMKISIEGMYLNVRKAIYASL